MQNTTLWQPSKFEYKNNKLVASQNPKNVHIGSRLMVNLIAQYYNNYLKKYANGKLLDLGCGNIPLYAAYKPYITENVCIDWGNTPHKNPFLDIEHDLNTPLPIANNQFDTIILSDVLEHIENPFLLWQEMSRILKPKGNLILNVPFYYWLHETPYDYYRYTRYALQKFAEKNNFEILELSSIGGVPEILADILGKLFIHIPLIGKTSTKLVQYLACTKLAQKISQKTSTVFPFGYFLVAQKK